MLSLDPTPLYAHSFLLQIFHGSDISKTWGGVGHYNLNPIFIALQNRILGPPYGDASLDIYCLASFTL